MQSFAQTGAKNGFWSSGIVYLWLRAFEIWGFSSSLSRCDHKKHTRSFDGKFLYTCEGSVFSFDFYVHTADIYEYLK